MQAGDEMTGDEERRRRSRDLSFLARLRLLLGFCAALLFACPGGPEAHFGAPPYELAWKDNGAKQAVVRSAEAKTARQASGDAGEPAIIPATTDLSKSGRACLTCRPETRSSPSGGAAPFDPRAPPVT